MTKFSLHVNFIFYNIDLSFIQKHRFDLVTLTILLFRRRMSAARETKKKNATIKWASQPNKQTNSNNKMNFMIFFKLCQQCSTTNHGPRDEQWTHMQISSPRNIKNSTIKYSRPHNSFDLIWFYSHLFW